MIRLTSRLRPAVAGFVVAPLALVILASCVWDDSSSEHCAPSLVSPPVAPAYANTTWPVDHKDTWRTHAVAAGLPADVQSSQLKVTTAETPPTPTWGYLGLDGKVYVLGGAPFLLDVFTDMILGAPRDLLPVLVAQSKLLADQVTPYLARIDPATMQIEKLDIGGGTSVNYVGGVLVHSNGFLYTVARGILFKVDPATFRIVQSATLPLPSSSSGVPNENTAFNGMQATNDGDLILKGFASISTGGSTPGILLRVNPDDLSIRAQAESTTVAAARLTIATVNGQEFLYVPGATSSLRFRLEPNAFVPDNDFTQAYLQAGDGSSPGSSDVFMGNGVVFTNNTEPQATTPMHIFGQAATGGALTNQPAFASPDAGWNFFMVAGDPFQTGIVVAEDQLNGGVSGFVACADGRSVDKVWENSRLAVSAGAAIAYDRGHLYVDDRVCQPGGDCQLFFVVLDLKTGKELARTPVKGVKPSIGQIFIGPDAVYYPATDTGNARAFVNRIAVN